MSLRHRILALIVVAALATGAAGCGDDDAGDGVTTDGAGDGAATTVDDGGDEADPNDEPADGGPADDESAEETAPMPAACDLVDPTELEPLVGTAVPEATDDTAIDGLVFSQCEWETDDTLLIVAVVDGPSRYEMHTQALPGEPVTGVGDEAIVAAGMSSETRGGSGGRTVSALVGSRTVVVALRLTGQTTTGDIVPLATAVAERVASAAG